ncbi:MAG: hypothetical protein M1827_003190 [Pycnora praestabilis]|nr:MAG: hypothetical protein M1827_003190 [Pycnora praestabilis]
MELTVTVGDVDGGRHHKRTTSSVLKSMMNPRSHKRNPSAGATLSSGIINENRNSIQYDPAKGLPLLPPNHPHASNAVLGEVNQNRERANSSPKKPKALKDIDPVGSSKGLHKKTKSSISLRGLAAKGRDLETKLKGPSQSEEPIKIKEIKKSKSRTNLATLLSRPQSSKGGKGEAQARELKDKENQTPPSSASVPPPIWAQFASQPVKVESLMTAVPLNDCRDVDEEMAMYTPQEYSPSKQRNFHDHQPTLARRPEPKARPKSAYLASSNSRNSLIETVSGLRKTSNEWINLSISKRDRFGQQGDCIGNQERSSSDKQSSGSRRSSVDSRKVSSEQLKEGLTIARRGARVMAAVAAFNGKAKDAEKETQADFKGIEKSFEALLDARNVPQNMRQKLRSLDTNIKADFIKQDKIESGAASGIPHSTSVPFDLSGENTSAKRPTPGLRAQTDEGILTDAQIPTSPTKRTRPRSKTFTLNKSETSPTKKSKTDGQASHGRVKSTDFSASGSSKSLTSAGATQAMAFMKKGAPRPTVPEDFVLYLRKVQKPEDVEVSKLHKLRLLLRNETVAWVDSFIITGGMAEIVGLLHRIMAVEWREEHEDTLLHETLLCLKALCTTDSALGRLADIQATLFPPLLAMLFDEEKKGPSEFITRSIIVSLLFTYLATSPEKDLLTRAQTILSYLRDPSPPEEAQPLGFIVSMHQSRPYRVWCKEVVNVTKEVFWIFLHHLNVIPTDGSSAPFNDTTTYKDVHFPKERPPVPAAPYVGGVEWDATNYMATHLDLMNAIIASLPTIKERNDLRQQLKVSGFEKMMGSSLRTCKEKFYGAVHDGLKTWVSAALDDGWEVKDVRMGPPAEERSRVRSVSPKKKAEERAPKLELPKLELDVGGKAKDDNEAWV